MPFISFSCIATLARTSRTTLNSNRWKQTSLLLPDLKGKVSHNYDVTWGFFIDILHYQVWKFPSIPSLLSVFIMKWLEFIKCFSCVYWNDYVFFVLYSIDGILTDFSMLNQPWIPKINPMWLWCVILFICC